MGFLSDIARTAKAAVETADEILSYTTEPIREAAEDVAKSFKEKK